MRKMVCILLAAVLLLGCAACGSSGGGEKAETPDGGNAVTEVPKPAVRGLNTTVDRGTGALSLTRLPLSSRTYTGDAEKWTIFVYLCGTDLESYYGSATYDLIEMLDGAVGDGVRFVVQTGGAEEWWNDAVEAGKLQRYLIENEDILLVDEQPNAGMGRGQTLTDFLRWGAAAYPSEYMGVVLWDHGGGSITGVCFDETDGYDSISLRELDAALLDVCSTMERKYDFVGFDACLMGTLEAANILASYADYMIASEEIEPGSGWDYTAIGEYLSAHPGADALSLGKTVCDSFLESCRATGVDDLCTLAVVDLEQIDDLLVAFNGFARGMFDAAAEPAVCAGMLRGITKADNFGGNNDSEGYTNMVDLGGVIAACAQYAAGAGAARDALDSAVAYFVSGAQHTGASGLSMYYPLCVQGSQELSVFGDLCPSPYYVSFVDRQNRGSVSVGAAEEYDETEWFDDDGSWSWGLSDGLSESGGETGADEHWDYLNDYAQTGQSPLITFAVAPHIDENGVFWFELDNSGYDYAANVYGMVFEMASEDGNDIIRIGDTYNLLGGWDTGIFADDFDGRWISLPDGQNLATYIVTATEDAIYYTSPIRLNGAETNLRLKLEYATGKVVIEGAWDGISEYGALSREIVKLKEGDVITPLYDGYSVDGDDIYNYYYHGWDYTFDGAPELRYGTMEDAIYLFAFCIDDIYGDYYMSEWAAFAVEDGTVTFYDI